MWNYLDKRIFLKLINIVLEIFNQVAAIDLLILSVSLQILQTLPFDRVQVQVISLHFAYNEDKPSVLGNVARFLYSRGFEFVRRMEHNYFYQAIAADPEQERKHEQKAQMSP